MTTFFISRHPGARDWIQRNDIAVDAHVAHLDMARIRPGDTVIGTLPVHLAAEVCSRGACYLHLSLNLPTTARGRELTADEMEILGAKLEPYVITQSSSELARMETP